MRSFSAQGLVLKRVDTGELDRMVTLFTQEQGKLVAVAKGSRRLTSSKLAALEPGSFIQAYFTPTKSLPILTQARLTTDFASLKTDLKHIRNFFQVLEMLDALLPEGDAQPEVFEMVMGMLTRLATDGVNPTLEVRSAFADILSFLGFVAPDSIEKSVGEVIEDLTQKRLKAFAYLTS